MPSDVLCLNSGLSEINVLYTAPHNCGSSGLDPVECERRPLGGYGATIGVGEMCMLGRPFADP